MTNAQWGTTAKWLKKNPVSKGSWLVQKLEKMDVERWCFLWSTWTNHVFWRFHLWSNKNTFPSIDGLLVSEEHHVLVGSFKTFFVDWQPKPTRRQLRRLGSCTYSNHQDHLEAFILQGGVTSKTYVVGGWTNPFEKIWVKMGIFPNFRGEH